MGVIGSTSDSVSAIIERAENPTITHLDMPVAGDEYNHTLQTDVRILEFEADGDSIVKFAFVATESGTKGYTVDRHCAYERDKVKLTGKTLYVQADKNNETLLILEWV